MTFYLISEQLQQIGYQQRQGEAKHDGSQHDNGTLRAHLAAIGWLINQTALVGCGSQRDGILLTLLQQHQIKARLHFLLSAYLGQHAFLFWCIFHLGLELTVLFLNALTIDVGRATCLTQGFTDTHLQLVEQFSLGQHNG